VCGTGGHTRNVTLRRVTQFYGDGLAEPVGHLITGDLTLSPIW
jgi:hypothetical protein